MKRAVKIDNKKNAGYVSGVFIMLILIISMCAGVVLAAGGKDQTVIPQENGQKLIITVEGEDQADSLSVDNAEGELTDIGDQDVPLAEGPKGSPRDMHAAWAMLFLICSIIYALYFRRKQNKLFKLRRLAAEAEHEASISVREKDKKEV